MDADIKQRWVRALRSADYEMGTGALKQVDELGNAKYCCLGVLCEVAAKAGVIPPSEPSPDYRSGSVHRFGKDAADATTGYLPDSVKEWAGLEHNNPRARVPDHERARTWNAGEVSLADLNDSGYYTFAYISDFIDTHF